jgi:hypothetical protein
MRWPVWVCVLLLEQREPHLQLGSRGWKLVGNRCWPVVQPIICERPATPADHRHRRVAFGPDWIFGRWDAHEPGWCKGSFESINA